LGAGFDAGLCFAALGWWRFGVLGAGLLLVVLVALCVVLERSLLGDVRVADFARVGVVVVAVLLVLE
jgi:hypothetical protein